jgi:hypothetical protein
MRRLRFEPSKISLLFMRYFARLKGNQPAKKVSKKGGLAFTDIKAPRFVELTP